MTHSKDDWIPYVFRPILGYINFCPQKIYLSYPQSIITKVAAVHELGHAFVSNSAESDFVGKFITIFSSDKQVLFDCFWIILLTKI